MYDSFSEYFVLIGCESPARSSFKKFPYIFRPSFESFKALQLPAMYLTLEEILGKSEYYLYLLGLLRMGSTIVVGLTTTDIINAYFRSNIEGGNKMKYSQIDFYLLNILDKLVRGCERTTSPICKFIGNSNLKYERFPQDDFQRDIYKLLIKGKGKRGIYYVAIIHNLARLFTNSYIDEHYLILKDDEDRELFKINTLTMNFSIDDILEEFRLKIMKPRVEICRYDIELYNKKLINDIRSRLKRLYNIITK